MTDDDTPKGKRQAKTTPKGKPQLRLVASAIEAESAEAGEARQAKGKPRGRAYKGQPKTSAPKSAINSEGLTAKQEAFCMAILEGKGFSEAYREAYDAENMAPATVHREAYTLATNPKIAARLERAEREKQAEQRMQRLSRAERTLQKLEEIALRAGDPDGTQVRALELLGKTMGLFVDRVETEDKTDRSAEDIRRDLEQRLQRLLG